MRSRREELEAQQYDRRRIVAAFVSGRPDGGEQGPSPGRTLVGGLVLAVLLVVGVNAVDLVDDLDTDATSQTSQLGRGR